MREDFLNAALATIGCFIIESDLGTGRLCMPPVARRFFGLPGNNRDVAVAELLALVHPDDIVRYLAERQHSIESRKLLDTTARIIRPDGTIRHLRVVAVSPNDNRSDRCSLVQDVTDMERVSENQWQTQVLLNVASSLARLGGWRTDVATGRVDATAGTRAIYSLPADEDYDIDLAMSCYSPSDRGRLFEAHALASAEGSGFDGEFAITALDGTPKWVRVSLRPEAAPGGLSRSVVGAIQDIGEIVALRSKAEQQALHVHNMIENMPDAFFLHDRQMRFTYANPAGERMLDLATGQPAQWRGQVLWEVLPELQPQLRQRFEQMLEDGKPVTVRVSVKSLHQTFLVNAHLTPDGIGVHVRDVTDEIRAQEALLHSEERYRLAYKASQDVLFDWDLDADELVFSDAMFERFGYDPKVFPRSIEEWLSIVHPEDRPSMRANVNQALQPDQPEQWSDEYRMVRGNGSIAYVIERGLTILRPDGRPRRMIGTITDVSHVHAEEQRLRAIVNVAADAIYEYDVARNTTFFSEGIRRSFGHGWTGEQPKLKTWLEVLHPEDRETVLADFQTFCAGRDMHWRSEYRMQRADGTFAIVSDRAAAVRDASGALLRVVGSMEDVTLARHAEKRMKHALRIEAIGKLTGGVAHDFNNLLTVILGNADLLEASPQLNEENKALAATIVSAAERGGELTAGLLAFAGKQPLAPKVLDLGRALDDIHRLLERTLPADISLEIITKPDLWLVEADASQLNAAILNLAVNARDAMPRGGKLLIECGNAHLDDAYVGANPNATAGDYLRIAVSDTGTGMTPDVVAQAFEPFFTTKTKGAGTGMGLSMVLGFVQQSGGHAKIYSEPGHGTTLSIYLPRSHGALAEAEPEDVQEAAMLGNGQLILVVEDNALLLPRVVALVTGLNYRVSAAANAEEALAILQASDDIDLLFTDIVMPGSMNGAELARVAKDMHPELKVLFTSGYTEEAIIHHGRLEPGVKLLSKPYRRRDLAIKLRQAIEGHV